MTCEIYSAKLKSGNFGIWDTSRVWRVHNFARQNRYLMAINFATTSHSLAMGHDFWCLKDKF